MVQTQGPVSPLNAVWLGTLRQRMTLPRLGHLLLLFPLAGTAVSCASVTITLAHYLMLITAPNTGVLTLDPLERGSDQATLLVLWLSPGFIAEMARFLDIPEDVEPLLQGVPLLQGDQITAVVAECAAACRASAPPELVEDLFLEVVGEVLQLMRLRHQALVGLAQYKENTIADLLPLLLQARQFVEARYTQKLKTKDVADFIGLSEFHFGRLFKTAFDTTLHQYVIQLRMDEARRFLEQPGATVTETAYHIGYNSLSSFIHAFTRQFKRSPAQYQAQIKMAQDLTSSLTP